MAFQKVGILKISEHFFGRFLQQTMTYRRLFAVVSELFAQFAQTVPNLVYISKVQSFCDF